MDNQFELPKEGVRIYNPDSGWQTGPESPIAPSQTASAGASRRSHEAYDEDDGHDDHDDARDNAGDLAEDNAHRASPSGAQNATRSPSEFAAEPIESPTAASEDTAPPVMPMPVTGTGFRSRRATNGDRVYTARAEPFVSGSSAQTVKPYPRPMASAQESAAPHEDNGGTTLVPQTQAAALARVGDSLDSLFTVIQRATVHQVVDGNAPSWRDVANISRHLEDRLNTRQHLLKELHSVDQEIRETRQDLLLTLNALSEYEQQNLQAASMRASISAVAAKVIAKRFAESGGE